ncbi:hypothetical protein SAY87_007906 [Trapa incisa]|uniref:Uncharacterized protein n=1 Tax=Trapa incisa TaxID=236973 RepID=A0AAN7QFT2_9MYRT|nr:hypothetical protein SAY87_007906 [Trapa incisa]
MMLLMLFLRWKELEIGRLAIGHGLLQHTGKFSREAKTKNDMQQKALMTGVLLRPLKMNWSGSISAYSR